MNIAKSKWLSIAETNRTKILSNVWCTNCKKAVTIDDYKLYNHTFGVILKGKCLTCGLDVARFIEDE